MDIVDSQSSFYDDWYAELIPYMRGCVYLLQIDSSLRNATGIFGFDQMSPLDDIIVDMGKRWQRGERLQASDWLAYLRPYLGDMSQGFRAMLRGTAMDLNEMLIAHEDWTLASSMQEILEIGFDKSSTNQRIVSGLVQGSRAAIAGLKNGDKILSTSRASLCSTSLSATFQVSIARDCQEVQISYWPRSFSKARAFYLQTE
jgi:predicted metalloprotease with PDZ domain